MKRMVFLLLSSLTTEIDDGDPAQLRRSQLYGPWPSGSEPRGKLLLRDDSSPPDNSRTAKSGFESSGDRDASTICGALTTTMTMDADTQCFVLSKNMDTH